MTDTEQQLAALQAEIARIAKDYPTAVLMAMLDQLVEVACGGNQYLIAIKKVHFYRGVLRSLAAHHPPLHP
jgi:hypothetical protein